LSYGAFTQDYSNPPRSVKPRLAAHNPQCRSASTSG